MEGLPIIGASTIGNDWFMVIPIVCGKCKTPFLLVGQPGIALGRSCPGKDCGEVHVVPEMPEFIPETGNYNWKVGRLPKPLGT